MNPNLMERWNGQYKERYKDMRAFKKFKSAEAISRGFVIHYNFLVPHGSLGKTPAQAGGVNLPFEDGWGDLIRGSI